MPGSLYLGCTRCGSPRGRSPVLCLPELLAYRGLGGIGEEAATSLCWPEGIRSSRVAPELIRFRLAAASLTENRPAGTAELAQ